MKAAVPEMIADIRTVYSISDEKALYIRPLMDEKVADTAIGTTVRIHWDDRVLDGAHRSQVNGEILISCDGPARYEEPSDPMCTQAGGVCDIMAMTIIQTNLASTAA